MAKYYGLKTDWKDRWFGIKCPHCGERTNMRRNQYVRGYNEWCEQAMGDDGFNCMACMRITWRTSFEEEFRITPTWCKVYPDSARAKWFPDFKFNRDTSRIPDHPTHAMDAEKAGAQAAAEK